MAGLPTGVAVPLFVGDDFDRFQKDMIEHARAREGADTIFLEFAAAAGGR